MNTKIYTTIVATGSHVPPRVVKNEEFLDAKFFDPSTKEQFDRENDVIIQRFEEITKIKERRYAEDDENTSDLAYYAAKDAIESSNYDAEELDFIIVSHNFGDATIDNQQVDIMPALANRVKGRLGVKNPQCFVHDVIAGCPGWVSAMGVANGYLVSGMCKKGLVIGSDINTRYADPYDRDKMIFADGAGAVIVEAKESETPVGFLSMSQRADCGNEINYLLSKPSLNEEHNQDDLYIRMLGNKVYVYALSNVPAVVKDSLDKAGLDLSDVKKVLIHQANEKMDEAILARIFRLYGRRDYDMSVMPMTIRELGNSSTATVPTLLDLVLKGKMEGHEINSGDVVVFASVGAGMNINSIVYKMP